MSNKKGGLIRKKKPSVMRPPVQVKKAQEEDFAYTGPTNQVIEPPVIADISKKETPKKRKTIGKSNSTKSIKVPTYVHSEINLLGSFMDENKTYAILQVLIDSYVKNELTNRQQRQFEFMMETFNEEN